MISKSKLRKRLTNKEGMLFFDGRRVVLMNHEYTAQMYIQLKKIIGPPAKTILYEAAKKSTKKVGAHLFKRGFLEKALLKTMAGKKKIIEIMLAEYWPYHGFGYGKLISFSKEEIVLRIWNNTYSAYSKKDFEELGAFTDVAIIEASIELVMNKPYRAIETRSTLRGDPYCEIHLFPK